MRTYNQLVAVGKQAAMAFGRNIKSLLGMVVVAIHDMQDDEVEGCDFDTVIVRWIRTDMDAETKALMAEFGQPIDGECLKPELVHGGIEVKCMQPNQSLHRDDLPEINCISIPLGKWTGKKKGKPSRKNHGWFRRIFQPEWEPSSAEPLILEYILECWDNHGGKRPYASIAFTDFPEFKRRIIEYGKENGLDPTNWESVPIGKEAENYKCGGLLFRGNVWFVPLDLLVKTAKIIIIGDAPRFYKNGKCTIELQETRYRHLCEHADTHVSEEDFCIDGEITSSVPDHPVFDLLRLDAVKAPSEK